MANGVSFDLKEQLWHVKDIIDIEALGWQLRGDFLAFNFQIVDAAENVIATAHRKVVSLHGIYTLDIADEH